MSDPFEQIGPKLTQAREAMGLELAVAARQAGIPVPAAQALEAEDFSHFDSPVYAKSFLLQYSGFLEVDAQTWLDALEPGAFMATGTLLRGPEAPARRKDHPEPEARGGGWAVILLLLVTAAIIYGVIKGFEFFEARHDSPQPPSQKALPDAP